MRLFRFECICQECQTLVPRSLVSGGVVGQRQVEIAAPECAVPLTTPNRNLQAVVEAATLLGMIDAGTAQLHLTFGLLMITALLLHYFIIGSTR